VRIYHDEQLIARELCESEDDAAAVVDHWSALGNVSFLVDDLSVHHTPGDLPSPDQPDPPDVANEDLPDRECPPP
jgi:hypothetical protein